VNLRFALGIYVSAGNSLKAERSIRLYFSGDKLRRIGEVEGEVLDVLIKGLQELVF